MVLSVTGATRQRGGDDGFRLEVPRLGVRRGECIAITGPSGCGKSTLLDLLGLVLRPDRCTAFEMRPRNGHVVDVARQANGKVYVIMALLAAAKVAGLAELLDAAVRSPR